MEFDETKAIEYINAALINSGRNSYPEDEILNVIDMIWDFYEENGLLDIDDEPDDEDLATEEEISDYVIRMIKKDKDSQIDLEDVPLIVNAEIEYEASIDLLD